MRTDDKGSMTVVVRKRLRVLLDPTRITVVGLRFIWRCSDASQTWKIVWLEKRHLPKNLIV